MKEIDFDVFLSNSTDFNSNEKVSVETVNGEKFIFTTDGANKTRKFKITDSNEKSIEMVNKKIFTLIKYGVTCETNGEKGVVEFGIVANFFVWFSLHIEGLPLSPRSGSGGGLKN